MVRISQTYGCLIAFAALLNVGTCGKPEARYLTPTTMPVSIRGCKIFDPSGANADPIVVAIGNPVTWKVADTLSYTIKFETKYDYNHLQDITPPDPTFASGQATWLTSNAHIGCSRTSTSAVVKDAGCYFKYSIFHNNQVCNDPGVLVQPD
jgi:hypothetical protein